MKITEGMIPNFKWAILFQLGKYTVWSRAIPEENNEVIYQITEGQEPDPEGGYYHLGWLLSSKNL